MRVHSTKNKYSKIYFLCKGGKANEAFSLASSQNMLESWQYAHKGGNGRADGAVAVRLV